MKNAQYRGQDSSSSIGLLISILLRYPEIATINFDPERNVLKFTFISSESFTCDRFSSFERKLKDSLEVYCSLTHWETPVVELNKVECNGISLVEVNRDVDTLSQGEISLIIELTRTEFGSSLVSDRSDLEEDDLAVQDELIEDMLETLKESHHEKKLIGFREEGRVLVFNKTAHNRRS